MSLNNTYILVICSNPDQDKARRILTAGGARVIVAENTALGFDLAQTYLPDAILLESAPSNAASIGARDFMMRLRGEPKLAACKVLLLTEESLESENHFRTSCAHEFLLKPVAASLLLHKMRTLIGQKDELRLELTPGSVLSRVNLTVPMALTCLNETSCVLEGPVQLASRHNVAIDCELLKPLKLLTPRRSLHPIKARCLSLEFLPTYYCLPGSPSKRPTISERW